MPLNILPKVKNTEQTICICEVMKMLTFSEKKMLRLKGTEIEIGYHLLYVRNCS